MNQFSTSYKKLTISELIKIIDNPGDYQPEAMEAANVELNSRQLNADELAAAAAVNHEQNQPEQSRYDKIAQFESKAKGIGNSVLGIVHPIQAGASSTSKTITRISIVLLIFFIAQLYNQSGFIVFAVTSPSSTMGWQIIPYLLPLLLLGIASFLFWRRKKTGWIMLSIFLTYTTLADIILLFMELRALGRERSFISIMPATPVGTYIGRLLLFAACIYFVYKKEVREIYNISTKNIIVATGFGALLTLLSATIG